MKTRFFNSILFFVFLGYIWGGFFVTPKAVFAAREAHFVQSANIPATRAVSTVSSVALSARTENSFSWRDWFRFGFGILTVRADTSGPSSVYELGLVGVLAPFFMNPFVTAIGVVIFAFSVSWFVFLYVFPPERIFLYWHRRHKKYVVHRSKKHRFHFSLAHKRSLFFIFVSSGFLLAKILLVAAFGSFFLRAPGFSFADMGGSVAPGGTITYTARYSNTSPQPLSNFTISDRWPSGVKYVSGSARVNGVSVNVVSSPDGRGITVPIGTLSLGESGEAEWSVRVGDPISFETLKNSVRFAADGFFYAESNTVKTTVTSLTLSGKVFQDLNANQTLDASTEAGLRGVEVRLYEDTNNTGKLESATDRLVTKQDSGVQGVYSFAGLAGGTFFVRVQDSTLPDSRYKSTTDNPLRITVRNGQSKSSQDFGYTLPHEEEDFSAHLGDLVWEDGDRDGVFDAGKERALSDVTLFLWRDSDGNGSLGRSDSLLDTTTSDGDGWYDFTITEKGKYFVSLDSATLPSGYSATTDNIPYVRSFDSSTGSSQTADFGFASPTSSVGDEVFLDANRNGVRDSGETGIRQVKMNFYRDSNSSGVFEASDVLEDSVLTNDSGRYSFERVASDTYFVRVDESTLASGAQRTTASNPLRVEVTGDSGEVYSLADFGYFLEGATVSSPSPSTSSSSSSVSSSSSSSTTPSDEAEENTEEKSPEENDVAQENDSSPEISSDSEASEPTALVESPPETSDTVLTDADEVVGVSSEPVPSTEEEPIVMNKVLSSQNGKRTIEFAGFTEPYAEVFLQVFSDDPVSYAVTADEEGYWKATVDMFLFASGTHRVYAQARTADGKSFSEELGYFTVQFDYADDRLVWMVMGVLILFSVSLSLFISRSRIFYGYMSKEDLKKDAAVDVFSSLERMTDSSSHTPHEHTPKSNSKTSP